MTDSKRQDGNMPETTNYEKRKKIVKLLTAFYLIPLGIMVLFNAGNSLLRTTYFDLYKDMETAKYKWDNPILLLIVTGTVLFLLYRLSITEWFQRTGKLSLTALLFGTGVSLVIVLLVRGTAICDGETVSEIAISFMQGNYDAFRQGEYLYNYSFQIGLTAFLEVLYHLAGVENYLAFQIINVAAVAIILFSLDQITKELFPENVRKLESVLSMGMLPLFLFSTFVYGDLIGWAFGMLAIWQMLCYLKRDGGKYLLRIAVLLACGIVIKSNINIVLVAVVIAVLLNCFQKRKYRHLLYILPMILLPVMCNSAIEGVYVQRAGLDRYPEGIPKLAWVAMSMQEGDEGGYACGWYNGYNWAVYGQNGFDRTATEKACMENLKQSLSRFLHEQKYALNYFYKKFTSQWNAPDFQAMISNEWCTRHSLHTIGIAKWFLFEEGREILLFVMNGYHFLIFLLTGTYFGIEVFRKRDWDLPKAYFMLNIFGGFLFHMIWEAQSRYVLGYFVLMLPLAAAGLADILDNVRERKEKRKEKLAQAAR